MEVFFLFICVSIKLFLCVLLLYELKYDLICFRETVMVMPLKNNKWCNVEVSLQQYEFHNNERELTLVEKILYVFTIRAKNQLIMYVFLDKDDWLFSTRASGAI